MSCIDRILKSSFTRNTAASVQSNTRGGAKVRRFGALDVGHCSNVLLLAASGKALARPARRQSSKIFVLLPLKAPSVSETGDQQPTTRIDGF